jgi:hypothetical protein
MYKTNCLYNISCAKRTQYAYVNVVKRCERFPIVRKRKLMCQCLSVPHSLALSTMACSAKVVSYIFTYPFETYKIYSQLEKTPSNIRDLYQGFGTFVVIATVQCFLNYNVFFALINALKGTMPQHVTYFYASAISCFVTSFIKVPMTYISRNIVFEKNRHGISAVRHILSRMDKDIFRKSWLTNILGDIPDSFIKFFINSWIQGNVPMINNFNRSCITGFITSVINMPVDFALTQTMCKNADKKTKTQLNIRNNFFSKCMLGVQYRVIACMIGNVIFFNIFNLLQSQYNITV